MINLIECNIVIPIITTVNKGDDIDKIIHHYAMKYAIVPSHIIVVQPKKDELTVDQIHLMQKDIQVAFSQLVLVVLREVDNSSNEVQNSLLKCLEEDANRIVFLLLVKNPARLLSTIRSRCMVIDYKPAAGKLKLAKDYTEDYTKVFSFAKNSEVSKEISIDAIDIVAPCFSAFYKLSEEIENIYFLNNSDLLLREVFIASLLVCMAIEAGYLDYDFLKNVFNTELKINHELAAAKISAYHLEELEKKRIGKIREFSDQSLMYSFTDYAKKASSQINDGSIYEQSLKSLCDTNGEEVSPVSFGDLFLIKSAIEKEISFVGTSLKEIDFSLLLVEILKHKEVTKFYKVISLEKVS